MVEWLCVNRRMCKVAQDQCTQIEVLCCATGLKEGWVNAAAGTNTDILHALDEEMKRHSQAVKNLAQRCVGRRMNDAADAMQKAAVALEPRAGSSSASNPAESTTATGQQSEEGGKSDLQCPKVMFCNGDEEQVSKTEAGDAIPAPARSSTHTKKSFRARSSSDMRCPHCTMNCDGTRGLATQLGNCKKRKRIDVEQAPSAKKAVDSKFLCPKCSKKYGTKASLRIHQYRCKGPSGQAPLADTICPLCSKVCKGTRGRASHSRNCQGIAGAGNVDAAAAPAKRRRQSKPKEQTGAASAGVAEAVAASASAAEAAETRHQQCTLEEQPVVSAPHDQQPRGGPAPYQLPVDRALLHSTVQLVAAERQNSDVGKRLGFCIDQAVKEMSARKLAGPKTCQQVAFAWL